MGHLCPRAHGIYVPGPPGLPRNVPGCPAAPPVECGVGCPAAPPCGMWSGCGVLISECKTCRQAIQINAKQNMETQMDSKQYEETQRKSNNNL